MGYTERAAVERLRVAKAIEEVPQLGEAMTQGDLSFSGARELSRVITPETQQEWIDAAQEKSVRQIEEMVSGHKPGDRPTDGPDPALKTRVLRHEVRLSVAELERRARKALQRQRGSAVDDSDFMEACFKALLDRVEGERAASRSKRSETSTVTDAVGTRTIVGAEAVVVAPQDDMMELPTRGAAETSERGLVVGDRVLTESDIERLLVPRYQLAATRCVDCKRGWQHGTSATSLLTPPELERAMCDCIDIGDVDADEPARAKRTVPKALKRHVLHRDGYQCRVPGCRATENLDAHHIKFWMHGGVTTAPNLLCLCEGHHLAVHAGSLVITGDAVTAAFTWSKQNSFKIETRAVECTAALRARGIAKRAVRTAVDATRTHVGQQDLTAQQWIDIALSKLPPEARGA
ncbi:MAG TPA: hypothetical protein VMZ53_12045 [Kofleriaceae bacterium]|nr:hypothetical protein [Kofleriaceae bacterium]